jgi:hypothetical protein
LISPANDFVRKFVSSDDFYEALRALRVGECIGAAGQRGGPGGAAAAAALAGGAPTVSRDATMGEALQSLIRLGKPCLVVTDAAMLPVGTLSFDNYRDVAARSAKNPAGQPPSVCGQPRLCAAGDE